MLVSLPPIRFSGWHSIRRRFVRQWRPAATFLLLALITVLAGLGRWYAVTHYSYNHPDEEIARAVVVKILKSDEDDTNWARTDVIGEFHYTEYNFSSYYLLSAYIERWLGHTAIDLKYPAGALRTHLREQSAILGALCVLLTGLFAWQVGGQYCGLLAAILCSLSTTLFEDSLYARPETFVTALTLVFMGVLATKRVHGAILLFISGLLVGLLIACKISFLIYAPFPLLLAPALLSTFDSRGSSSTSNLFPWSAAVGGYLVAVGIGFAAGVPYAIRYPWEFTDGLGPLLKQYIHGVQQFGSSNDDSVTHRVVYRLAYLAQTIGYPALLLALIGIACLIKRNLQLVIVLAGPLLALLYFLQTRTFFERNFSQSLPVVFVLAGIGASAILSLLARWRFGRTVIGCALAGLCALAPAQILVYGFVPALSGSYQQHVFAEAGRLADNGEFAIFYKWGSLTSLSRIRPEFCGRYIYMTEDFDHPGELQHVLALGYRLVERIPSVFGDYPVSTLQHGLAPSMVFIGAPPPGSCPLELGPLHGTNHETALKSKVALGMGWNREPRAGKDIPPAGWPWPVYYFDADSVAPSLQIGPFLACKDFSFPIAIGKSQRGVSLQILRLSGRNRKVIFSGTPPTSDGEESWEQITIHPRQSDCDRYLVTVSAFRPSRGCAGCNHWLYLVAGQLKAPPADQWLAIGMPAISSGVTSASIRSAAATSESPP